MLLLEAATFIAGASWIAGVIVAVLFVPPVAVRCATWTLKEVGRFVDERDALDAKLTARRKRLRRSKARRGPYRSPKRSPKTPGLLHRELSH